MPTLLPAILISLLSLLCSFILLRGLHRALARTSWEPSRQHKIFRTTLLLLVLWILVLGGLSLQGFFADFSKLPPRVGLAVLHIAGGL